MTQPPTKSIPVSSLIVGLVICAVCSLESQAPKSQVPGRPAPTAGQLLTKLRNNDPFPKAILLALEDQAPSDEIITGLKEIYDQRVAKEDRQSREYKRDIAVTLIRFGTNDDRYSRMLERYA